MISDGFIIKSKMGGGDGRSGNGGGDNITGRRDNGSGYVSEWEDNIIFDADDPDFCNTSSNASTIGGGGGGGNNDGVGGINGGKNCQLLNAIMLKVPSTMSLAEMQNPVHHFGGSGGVGGTGGRRHNNNNNNNHSISSSISDLVGSLDISSDNVLTIEELRAQMGSCFTCGVSWTDDHVSLDCSECGGYSTERPCIMCDGGCGTIWKRDFTMSHACSKARWLGVCPKFPQTEINIVQTVSNTTNLTSGQTVNSNIGGVTHTTTATAATTGGNNHHTHYFPMTVQNCGVTHQFLAQELCARLEQLSASAQT